MTEKKGTIFEDIKVKADDLVKTVKNIIKEGNVRKITIKNNEGNEIASFPITAGVVGVLLAPVLAALGALAAVLSDCTITVEKDKK